MDVATLVLAVVGLALSMLSLGWQAATFVLSGGRANVELLLGAVRSGGGGFVTMSVQNPAREWAVSLKDQGYTHPVVAVRVRNVGRLPLTVERWSIVALLRKREVDGQLAVAVLNLLTKRQEGPAMVYPGPSVVGPPFPHRLEAGASEIWAADLADAEALLSGTKGVFSVAAKVALGDGRSYRSKHMIRA